MAVYIRECSRSVLDGWWPESCIHGVNGWQIGDGYEVIYVKNIIDDEGEFNFICSI